MALRNGRAALIAVVPIAALFSLVLANRSPKPIAYTHLSRGILCASCHSRIRMTLVAQVESCLGCKEVRHPVAQQNCLVCHGSYAAIAARTSRFSANPHKSHRGEIECKVCHKGHHADQNSCSTAACHPNMTFNRKGGASAISETD